MRGGVLPFSFDDLSARNDELDIMCDLVTVYGEQSVSTSLGFSL